MRTAVQLTVMGYVLMLVFDHPAWRLSLLVAAGMMVVHNAIKRVNIGLSPHLRRILGLSMVVGYGATTMIFIGVVLLFVLLGYRTIDDALSRGGRVV